jgi:hypothetical protein
MRSALVACTIFLLWGLSSSSAQAYYPGFCVPYMVAYEMRPVICYRTEWREEKVPCVTYTVNYRKEVKQVPTTVWVPKMFNENVRTSYYVPVPKVVERQVPRCVMVAMPVFDPCTGCCFAYCCPQWVVERVRCTVYDYRKEERNHVVQVCRLVEQKTVVEQVRWIPEVTEQKSWTVHRYCVAVPYQTMVCVPVCVPCWQ